MREVGAINRRYFSLHVDEESREAAIFIFGDITSWEWFDSDVSSYTLAKQIEGLDVDRINVFINSYGGEVSEGLAIYNQLRRHKAEVTTYCDGFACSAASVVFMAGTKRVMSSASLLFIHNAWVWTAGDANDMRKQADDLDTITAATKQAFMKHVNISEEELSSMMDDETWIGAADAVEMGFATSVDEATETDKPTQNIRADLARRLTQDTTLNVNFPDEVLERLITQTVERLRQEMGDREEETKPGPQDFFAALFRGGAK